MQSLLILHGALGASEQFLPLQQSLQGTYQVHTLDFSGHGKTPNTDAAFSISWFAQDVLNYLDRSKLDKVHLFGYSMGGYVAMYLAKHHPGRVSKVITLGTKFRWDETIAKQETRMLDPQQTLAKVPVFAETLKRRHAANDWVVVMNKTATMLEGLGKDNVLKIEDYQTVNTPCLLLLGDRDKMVSLDETVNVYKALPNAQMAVLPGTPHVIEKVDNEMLKWFIERFV
jgi:pimeloyl-ACP methyl ester carboxylesterase